MILLRFLSLLKPCYFCYFCRAIAALRASEIIVIEVDLLISLAFVYWDRFRFFKSMLQVRRGANLKFFFFYIQKSFITP